MSRQTTDGDGGKLAGASLLAAALATVTQPVWVLDCHGIIQTANPAAAATLGYADAGELLGRNAHDTVHVDRLGPEPHPCSECPLLLPRATGEMVTRELDRFVRRDGSTLPVSYVSAPLELSGGRGAVLAFIDIEAHRDAEQALTDRETTLTEREDALRRVAILVARETAPDPVFDAVASEAAALLRCDAAGVIRFEKDGTVTTVGGHHLQRPTGERLELDPEFIVAAVRRTGRAARFDTDDPAAPDMPEAVRAEGARSALASPIVVGSELWGAMAVGSLHHALPPGAGRLLADFTDLLATAVSNAQARADLERLADEQAALRRVATLVARGAPQADVFAAIAEEIQRLLGTEEIRMVRYEDGFAVVVASSVLHEDPLPVGSRHPLGGDNATSQVFRTGQPARIDDYTRATGAIADSVRRTSTRAVVGTPIAVERRLWGAIFAGKSGDEPLPPDTEVRLGQFTELMATAIANTEARSEVERLADEQAALRRVATLVAAGVEPADLFAAVSQEVAQLFGTEYASVGRFDPDGPAVVVVGLAPSDSDEVAIGTRLELDDAMALTAVHRTGRAARVDRTDWSGVSGPVGAISRRLGTACTVASPIVVEGRLWGCVTATARTALPLYTEDRLANFTDLVGTAIANAESRARVRRLADEQAALLRVATLVAEGAPASVVFGAVASEAGALFGADFSGMLRIEDATTVRTVATWAATGDHPEVPERWTIEAGDPMTLLALADAAVRVEDWESVPGEIARVLREVLGVACSVGCPITVEGRPWGALAIHCTQGRPLPPDTESRITQFTDLVGTAIANAESHARADRLADEQAALRRVATLVAQEASLEAVFAKVADEVARTLGDVDSALWRDDGDGTVSALAARGPGVAPGVRVGTRLTLDGDSVIARVLDDGRPHRVDDFSELAGSVAERARELGMRSAVGSPIVVGARTWGVMTVATYEAEQLVPETETRVARFSDLVATAIGNAEARAEVERLAREQAALRRVATLVAEGAPPAAVLDAVAAETGRALGAEGAMLLRYEPDEEVTVVARRVPNPPPLPPDARVSHKGDNVSARVRRTGRPARIADYRQARGPVADLARATEWTAAVGAPILLDGRLWGVIVVSWGGDTSPPVDAEGRLAKFAQLLEAAIANADSREQLTASRARLLTAADDARRRVVRDLHDGAQQRLVHAIINLKLAGQALEASDDEAARLVGEALTHAELGNEELRELAHGILPAALTNGGLRAGLDAVLARIEVPVRLDVPPERFAAEIEASAYFVVAEALTNVVKHAHAEHAEVRAFVEDGMLHVHVRDDGAGGADPGGHGLVGIADRVTALGGRSEVRDAVGGGTLVAVSMPL